MTKAVEAESFDYPGNAIAQETESELKKIAKKIVRTMDSTRESVIEAAFDCGEMLDAAQERLAASKMFDSWIRSEVGISRSSAYKQLNLHRKFGQNPELKKQVIKFIDVTAAYVLAAPTCPDKAVSDAMKLIDQGVEIKHKDAKQIVEKYTVDLSNVETEEGEMCPVCGHNRWLLVDDGSAQCEQCDHVQGEPAALDDPEEVETPVVDQKTWATHYTHLSRLSNFLSKFKRASELREHVAALMDMMNEIKPA